MSDGHEDEGSIAMTVAHFLSHPQSLAGDGWEVEGLDIGEVEIATPTGQRFRLSVEDVSDED